MIKKIDKTYELTVCEQEVLESLKDLQPSDWNKPNLALIKENIKSQLLEIQNFNCCYCGLKVNEGGRAEIDHIAMKGGPKRPAYPQFIFTPKNLVICCQYCNSSSKKGQEDVVMSLNESNYDLCTFKIVHPYLDEPNEHFNWSEGLFKILILGITDKARFSIELFELDSEAHTTARAKQVMFEKKLAKFNKRKEILEKVKRCFLPNYLFFK